MRKHLGRLPLCILLCLCLSCNALAADPTQMTDIQFHWARDAIYYVMDEALFSGTSETTFSPDDILTRGMFVTVLGRLAGVYPYGTEELLSYLYTDVPADAYYTPYVCWATRQGIAGGVGDGSFAPDEPITREQMATMAERFRCNRNYVLYSVGTASPAYADAGEISDYAAEAVETMRLTGVMGGTADENGQYWFSPQANATRGQCAILLSRLTQAMHLYQDVPPVEPAALTLSSDSLELRIGDFSNLTPYIEPADATNQTITWYSRNPAVATVSGGVVTARSEGYAEICAVSSNGIVAVCGVTVKPDEALAYTGSDTYQKQLAVFGQTVADPRTYYDPGDTSYLVWVKVRVWDFADTTHTAKVTQYRYIQVHRNIAANVEAIFEEIYNGPEQFPISDVGGYRANAGKSEHSPGLAIDINAMSNYYCKLDGTALTGTHWSPDTDPYSIPIGGDVDQAFAKYGFTRGIYWQSSGTKDYMHYSYFGT